MAIRCSVLGHAWGDPEVEREREKRGTTLVVAVREVRTCDRCGAREVLDEQTETAAPPGAEPEEETESDDETDDGEQALPAEEDDGVILDEDTDIGSGEWPDPGIPGDSEAEYEPRPWPDADPPDSGGPDPDDPDVIGAAEPADRSSGGTGEAVDPAEVLSEAAEEQAGEEQAGEPADGPEQEPGGAMDAEDLPLEDVEVYCPNCHFVDESPFPTLRGGDSCPNCRDIYLEERDT